MWDVAGPGLEGYNQACDDNAGIISGIIGRFNDQACGNKFRKKLHVLYCF